MAKINKIFNSLMLLLLAVTFQSSGAQLCRAALDCPANFAGDTVIVPSEVVMLSEIFEHCSPDSIKEGVIDTTTDTISLFIIIDHSGSMSLMDPNSERYKVANNIIDSIYAVSPASEVGLAVFSNRLMHNNSTDPFFNTLDNSEKEGWNDAYVPLTALNSSVSGEPAVEKLKWAIELDSASLDPAQNQLLKNADYSTSGRKAYTGGTDISLAFEAAKEAFASASNSKDRQFILFLSDGVHQLIDAQRDSFSEDYLTASNVPTTYTAYFINKGQPIPDQIKTMTENVQNNNYSASNFSSKVWSTQSQEQAFLDLLFNNIIGDGLTNFTSTPTLLIVNGDTATSFDSTYAYFDAPFAPLNKDGTLNLDISFTYQWNSPIDREETLNFSVLVQHGNAQDLDAVDCWEQGVIKFFSEGIEVTHASPTQTDLEVRFYLSEDSTAPKLPEPFYLKLENADHSDTLELELSLHSSKSYYYGSFVREYGSPAEDGKLQNLDTDSIIATYRNPKIPLDTVRSGIPAMPLIDLTITGACYRDLDANGHPDVISVYQKGGEVLTSNDCDLIKPFSSILSPREVGVPNSVTPESYGFSVSINQKSSSEEGKTDPYTSSTGRNSEFFKVNYQSSVALSSGNTLPFFQDSITDSMAPVINSATYIDLQSPLATDTLKVVFSEHTSPVASFNPFNIIQPGDSTSSFTMDLSFVKTEGDTSIFAVIPGGANPPVSSGDSIWISSAGGVSDLSGNVQLNENNVKRELKYYSAVSLVSASYKDNSPISDGLIDEISIITDADVDSATAAEIVSQIDLNESRNFTVSGFELSDNGFNILVSQEADILPVTSTDSLDVLNLPTLFTEDHVALYSTELEIIDSLPPVLTSASFSAGFKTEKDQIVEDTLLVTFSEAVAPAPYLTDEPFILTCGTGDTAYSMTLELISNGEDGKSCLFSVTDKSKPNPQSIDSVRINTLSYIQDLNGIAQDNDSNRQVPLSVKKSDLILSVSVTGNPGKSTDSFTLNGSSVTGIGIKTEILGNGWPEGVSMTGSLKIYDVVGNEVRDLGGIEIDDHSGFWFVWDARNENKRIVQSGSYLGVVTVKNEEENSSTREVIMIGVKN